MMFIKSENIYLRAISFSDVNENYLSWLNDPEVTKGLLSGIFPSNIETLRAFVQSVMNDRNTVMFAICAVDTHEHIGNIKIDKIDWIAGTCELGLLIGNTNYWGRGIGKEACSLVIDYAFKTLNLRKILLAVYSNNPRAKKLYENLGFVVEGNLQKHIYVDGDYIDKYLMSLFKVN